MNRTFGASFTSAILVKNTNQWMSVVAPMSFAARSLHVLNTARLVYFPRWTFACVLCSGEGLLRQGRWETVLDNVLFSGFLF